MSVYYVYAYLRLNGTPYYIGKGKQNRAFADHITHKPPGDKRRIIFIETNLTEVGALALERRYIRWYGRKDSGTGILRNKTDGGDGVSGLFHTQETKQKISTANRNKPKPPRSTDHRKNISKANKGRCISDEQKQKISESLRGRTLSEDHLKHRAEAQKGILHTEETKQKISEARRGKPRSEETKRKIAEFQKKRWAELKHARI